MVVPYKGHTESKKVQVAEMFNHVSRRYDFLNRTLSLGVDKLWRTKVIRLLSGVKTQNHLDIACGTGDFSIEALKLNPQKIYGIDISEGMIKIGNKKIKKKGLSKKIELLYGDAENIEFEDDFFDTITVGFGVRNFENLEKGLSEIHRVLSPSGKLAILELSTPKTFPVKQLYHFYSFKIIPIIGKLVSKDNFAYSYLPESVQHFPDGERFLSKLKEAGFKNRFQKRLLCGIVSIYIAEK